ncbi:hypothetical protein AVEN_273327-1 [Araneus ventricosus]|uniref:Uncharacterized protein n=1 Tax=Araneus ventricosus TaxID=182803 RepID=A0A4Y2IK93_ARAVE|nr:hypothetical protein AVEN_273327-1 [Araneus ventricosus]
MLVYFKYCLLDAVNSSNGFKMTMDWECFQYGLSIPVAQPVVARLQPCSSKVLHGCSRAALIEETIVFHRSHSIKFERGGVYMIDYLIITRFGRDSEAFRNFPRGFYARHERLPVSSHSQQKQEEKERALLLSNRINRIRVAQLNFSREAYAEPEDNKASSKHSC